MSEAAPEENQMAFERDLALRQAKLAETDMKVIRMALNENRPLEALRQINDAIDRLEENLDHFEDVPDWADGGDEDE